VAHLLFLSVTRARHPCGFEARAVKSSSQPTVPGKIGCGIPRGDRAVSGPRSCASGRVFDAREEQHRYRGQGKQEKQRRFLHCPYERFLKKGTFFLVICIAGPLHRFAPRDNRYRGCSLLCPGYTVILQPWIQGRFLLLRLYRC
jgi:hypothetical protein